MLLRHQFRLGRLLDSEHPAPYRVGKLRFRSSDGVTSVTATQTPAGELGKQEILRPKLGSIWCRRPVTGELGIQASRDCILTFANLQSWMTWHSASRVNKRDNLYHKRAVYRAEGQWFPADTSFYLLIKSFLWLEFQLSHFQVFGCGSDFLISHLYLWTNHKLSRPQRTHSTVFNDVVIL